MLIHILKGIATWIPGLYRASAGSTGGTDSARYCYSVWMRHLVLAGKSGLATNPRVVAEVGPGDSLGIGIAALLTGADVYYAFDVVAYARCEHNVSILREIAALLESRAAIPDDREFPRIRPQLESYEFPGHILSDERLRKSLESDRVAMIERALAGGDAGAIEILYIVPWFDERVLRPLSVDMVISQAVLEHLEDPAHAYQSLERWLKPGGYMSHQIDFGSHDLAPEWNGHWSYGDLAWRLIKGRRPYLLNRYNFSAHKELIERRQFDIVHMMKVHDSGGIDRKRLASRFKDFSDEELTTRSVFLQAVRR